MKKRIRLLSASRAVLCGEDVKSIRFGGGVNRSDFNW